MLRAMARPMPIPASLVVKKGSNIRSRGPPGTPGPVSSIETSAVKPLEKSTPRDLTLTASGVPDRIDPVHDQVQNDLLQLYAIDGHQNRMREKLRIQGDPVGKGMGREQLEHLLHHATEVHDLWIADAFGEQAAQSLDDLDGALVVSWRCRG